VEIIFTVLREQSVEENRPSLTLDFDNNHCLEINLVESQSKCRNPGI
ncbi:Uncharacterized protein APZ42_005540, partial [Daphnia magna]